MKRLLFLLLLTCVGSVGIAHAQSMLLTNNPLPRRRALLTIGINVSVTGSPVSFTLSPNTTVSGSSPLSIKTVILIGLLNPVKLYAYFDSTTALTTVNGDSIPASAVYGSCPSGTLTGFTPFTQATPFSANGLLLYSDASLLTLLASRTDTLYLQVKSPPGQPAGDYSGTLVFIAQSL